MFRIQQITVALVATVLFLHALQPRALASGRVPHNPEAAHADEILGYWQRGQGEAVIEVRRQADGYHGVIVASERQPELIGTEILKSLRYDAQERVWRGRVYATTRDREFKIKIAVPDSGHFVMSARVLFISRSVQFNRHPAVPSSEIRLSQR
jgi:uncharacterized protein (DUF2147 family)